MPLVCAEKWPAAHGPLATANRTGHFVPRPLTLPLVLDRDADAAAERPARRPDPRPGRRRAPSPVGRPAAEHPRPGRPTSGVSRAVTEQAYDQLAAEGWLESRHGSGTFVAAGARTRRRTAPSRPRRPPGRDCVRLDTGHAVDRPAAPRRAGAAPGATSRRPRRPAAYDDPARAARAARRARRPPRAHPRPDLRPRRDPGDHRHDRRPDASCSPRSRRARSPHEDPGYRAAAEAIRASGRDDPRPPGRRAGHRPRRRASRRYVTPAHQHPLGPVMPGADRLSLLDAAAPRRRGRDRGRLRLGVPLRRRAGARRSPPSTATASPTSAPTSKTRGPEHAAGLAGRAARPAPRDPGAPGGHPRRRAPGRCSARSSRCSATATSTRSSAPPAGPTPRGPRGSPTRCGPTPSRSCPSPGCTPPCPLPQARRACAPARSARAAGFEVPLLRDYCRTARLTGLIIGFGGCTDDELDRALAAIVARPRLTAAGSGRSARRRTRRTPRPARARSCGRGSTPCPTAAAKIAPSTNIIGDHEARARSRRPGSAQPERRTPTRQRSSPASSRQATHEPEPDRTAPSPAATSATLIITGVVRPSVIASRDRIAAHMPRRGERSAARSLAARLARRRRSSARASPTVTTEPVTSTAPEPIDVAERLAGLGQRRRLVDRVGQPRRDRDPVLAEDLARRPRPARRPASRGRWSSGCTTTCARCGSNAASTPSYVLVGHHADRRRSAGENAKESSSAAAAASAPCGLCAASSTIVGLRRMISSRPGRGHLGERLAHHARRRAGSLAEERLDRGQRDGGVLRLVGAVERQEDLVVARRAAPAATASGRRRPAPG